MEYTIADHVLPFDPTKLDHIPDEELVHDLLESAADLALCQTALLMGVGEYGDGSTTLARILGNQNQLAIIQQVLLWRQAEGRYNELDTVKELKKEVLDDLRHGG